MIAFAEGPRLSAAHLSPRAARCRRRGGEASLSWLGGINGDLRARLEALEARIVHASPDPPPLEQDAYRRRTRPAARGPACEARALGLERAGGAGDGAAEDGADNANEAVEGRGGEAGEPALAAIRRRGGCTMSLLCHDAGRRHRHACARAASFCGIPAVGADRRRGGRVAGRPAPRAVRRSTSSASGRFIARPRADGRPHAGRHRAADDRLVPPARRAPATWSQWAAALPSAA